MNKASGGDGISVELFQILKDGVWKCCTQYASKFGKLSSGHRTGKISFHFTPKESKAKECSNYCTTALLSHASKVMLKILQARLQQYMNHELQDVQAGFRKDRGSRNKIANIIKAAGEFQKNIYYCFPDYAKASCLTLSDPMDCSLPGSSTHGICQARVLEWGATAFSNNQPSQHIKKQRHYFANKGPFSLV